MSQSRVNAVLAAEDFDHVDAALVRAPRTSHHATPRELELVGTSVLTWRPFASQEKPAMTKSSVLFVGVHNARSSQMAAGDPRRDPHQSNSSPHRLDPGPGGPVTLRRAG